MSRLLLSPVLSLLLLTMGGCFFNPADRFNAADGSAGTVASELASMGSAADDLFGAGTGLPKGANAAAETMYVDIVVDPWTYDTAGGYWHRRAQAQFDNGTRVREDTVWLRDAAGSAVQTRGFAEVAGYRHVRASQTTAANTFEARYEMNVSINTSGADTTFTYNGTCAGSVNGSPFRSAIVADVVRVWRRAGRPHLGFPASGTVDLDLPLRTIAIVFTGQGSATATVTRKRDGEQVVVIINVHNGREQQP